MIDAEWSDRLIQFFESLLDFYKEFLSFEQEKYSIIASGKLNELDSYLKREQAFVLKARGLDQERIKTLEEAGAAEGTFREMIPQLEPSRQERMKSLYEQISDTVNKLQSVNKRCSQMTRLKLGRVSKVLSSLENHPELKQIYGKKLQNAGSEGTFSRKI